MKRKVIDCHTHCFPDKVAPNAVGALAATSFLIPDCDGTKGGLLRSMKACGIDLSIVLPIATSPKQVESCNRFAIELCREEGLISFGTMHPDYGDIKAQLRAIREVGLLGIKLHPDFQGYYIDSPEMVSLMKAAADEGLMIYLHGGLDISYPEINRCTPHRLARALTVLGDATVICTHMGGFGYFSDSIRYLSQTGVYIDTSAVLGYFPNDDIRAVIGAFGSDRVLFGTDSPWESPSKALETLHRLGLSDAELEQIEHINAEKLFGL